MKYSGGCLCGRVRYELTGDPVFPHYCSCDHCQKWSGAPVVAWVDFPRQSLTWDGPAGEPALYRSRKGSQRGFCSSCGSTICALDDGSDSVSITICTLDDPGAIAPESHSYPKMAPAWLAMGSKKRNAPESATTSLSKPKSN